MAVKLTRRTKYSFRVLNLAMLSILCTEAGYAYQPARVIFFFVYKEIV